MRTPKTLVPIFLLLAALAGLSSRTEAASLRTTRTPVSNSEPQRILDQSRGSLVNLTFYEVEAVGFPWDLSRSLRLSDYWFSSPTGGLVFKLSLDQTASAEGGGSARPLGANPMAECQKTLSGSHRFNCNARFYSRWGEFTEPGVQYHLVSTANASFDWTSVPEGSRWLAMIPPSIQFNTGEAWWKPQCLSSKPFWDATNNRCSACDPSKSAAFTTSGGLKFDKEGCGPGDPSNCPNPERMGFDPATQTCSCLPDFPVSILFGGRVIDCQTDLEHLQTTLPSFLAQVEGMGESSAGLVSWDCTVMMVVTQVAVHDPNSGEIIGWERSSESEVRCDLHIVGGNLAEGSLKGTVPDRQACFSSESGLGWHACPEDPTPEVPIAYPYIDLRAAVPVCQPSEAPNWCDDLNPPSIYTGPGSGSTGGGPDMIVSQSYLSPATPLVGEPAVFTVVLANVGGSQAPSHHYRVEVDTPGGSHYETDRYTGSFVANSYRQLTVDTSVLGYPALQAGLHTVTVTVDPTGDVAEDDETNNSVSSTFAVLAEPTGGPDLRILQIRPRDANPPSGEPLTVELTVRNSGDEYAVGTETLVSITDANGAYHGGFVTVPAIPAGGQRDVSFTTRDPVEPGQHSVDARADERNEVDETDEANNRMLASFEVADTGLECLPCTTGAPNNDLGDIVCFDAPNGVPADGIIMTCRGVRGDGTTCANDPNNPNGWENTGSQCADPSTLPPGWHPNRCGTPQVCPGTDT